MFMSIFVLLVELYLSTCITYEQMVFCYLCMVFGHVCVLTESATRALWTSDGGVHTDCHLALPDEDRRTPCGEFINI